MPSLFVYLNFYDLFVSGMLNFMMKCLVSWGTSLDSSNYRFIFFNSEKISSIISSGSFIVLYLTFRSMIHFKLI